MSRESNHNRRRPREPGGGLRGSLLRLAAVAALAGLCLVSFNEMIALRGELAAKRFGWLRRLWPQVDNAEISNGVVRSGMAEAELVLRFNRERAHALWQVCSHALAWSRRGSVDPVLRAGLQDLAVQAGLLAVRAAPGDYEAWELLARAFAAHGLEYPALQCIKRARDLAPEHYRMELRMGGVNILDREAEIERYSPRPPEPAAP